jgi:hypothetical protein
MPRTLAGTTLGAMVEPTPLRISLEFIPGAKPPAGRVSAPDDPDREFAGWTELFAALEQALRNEESEP